MKKIVLFVLKSYKRLVSPVLVSVFGHYCRFTPTCSQYTIGAVEKFGLARGLFLGAKRLSHCHPFSI